MTTLHIMVGLPCSGKTTYAKKLAHTQNALLLNPDSFLIQLNQSHDIKQNHDDYHHKIEQFMWNIAKRSLILGCNVILDFGFWTREERYECYSIAKKLHVDFQMHYMDTDISVILSRLEYRNQNTDDYSFVIPIDEMKKYISIFEIPSQEEIKSYI